MCVTDDSPSTWEQSRAFRWEMFQLVRALAITGLYVLRDTASTRVVSYLQPRLQPCWQCLRVRHYRLLSYIKHIQGSVLRGPPSTGITRLLILRVLRVPKYFQYAQYTRRMNHNTSTTRAPFQYFHLHCVVGSRRGWSQWALVQLAFVGGSAVAAIFRVLPVSWNYVLRVLAIFPCRLLLIP